MTVKERREKHIQALLEMRKVMLEDDGWENLKPYIEAVTSAGILMGRFNSEDMVSVIRCKDCKHCMIFSMFTSKWYVCCRNEKGVDVEAEDFCSNAERGNNERV